MSHMNELGDSRTTCVLVVSSRINHPDVRKDETIKKEVYTVDSVSPWTQIPMGYYRA